jgi:ABC-type branched-subunit amino acid transport system ATPase component
MTEQTMLKIEGANKRFGGLQALSNVGIDIKKVRFTV